MGRQDGQLATSIPASDLLPDDISGAEKWSCSAFRGSEQALPISIERPRGAQSHNKQGQNLRKMGLSSV